MWNIQNSFERYQNNNKREITPREAAQPPGSCEFRDRFFIGAVATDFSGYFEYVKDKVVQEAPGWNFSHPLNALILFRNALPEDFKCYESLILKPGGFDIPSEDVAWVVL